MFNYLKRVAPLNLTKGQYQLKAPFIMYADFESILKPVKEIK